MKSFFFKTVGDLGQIRQGNGCPGRGRNDFDTAELFGPLLPLLEAKKDLTRTRLYGSGGHVLARLSNKIGYLAQGKTVLSQPPTGNFYVRNVLRHVANFYLGDLPAVQQAVAQSLG